MLFVVLILAATAAEVLVALGLSERGDSWRQGYIYRFDVDSETRRGFELRTRVKTDKVLSSAINLPDDRPH
jgi:hypothetical protein